MIKRIKAAFSKPVRLPTFAKRSIYAMLVLWVIGAIYGMFYCLAELVISAFLPGNVVHLPELLAYLGGPVSCGLIGYLAKSAMESNQAMKQNYIPDYDNTVLGGEYNENDGIVDEKTEITEDMNVTGFYDAHETFSGE